MRQLLKKGLKSKVVENGVWLYMLQIFGTLAPALTVPYIVRVLESAQYGVFSMSLNIIGYLQVIVEYGFAMSATRKVALDGNQEKTNKMFTTILFARIILFVFSLILALSYMTIFNISFEQRFCILILSFSLIGYCVQLNWLFQGKQEMKYISIVNIVSRLLSLILIFVLVHSQDDLYLYCLLYSCAPIISGLLGIFFAKKKFKIHIVKCKIDDVVKEIQEGWYVFTTSLSSKIFGAIGVTILGICSTETEVGIYSAIQKIPNVFILVWMPISQIIYPVISKKMQYSFEEGKKFVDKIRIIILPFFTVFVVSVVIFARLIIQIVFGTEYAEYFYWVIPLMLWVLIAISNNFEGIQILLGSGRDKAYSKCFQISVLCTVVLNIVLIYFFHGTGASLAPLFSECILGVLLFFEIRKITRKENKGVIS